MTIGGRHKKILCALAVVVIACTACKRNAGSRAMPRMAPPFMYLDKQPMGTNIAYRLLPQQFYEPVSLVSKSTSLLYSDFSYVTGTTYISIGKDLSPGDDGLRQLLNFVKKGNEFFISATAINSRLLDTLGIESDIQPSSFQTDVYKKQFTSLRIADTALYGKTQYGFFYYPLVHIFTKYDAHTTHVLGVNQHNLPNYVVVNYGMGKFYFHLAPSAFTNYFLLSGQNTEYYKQVFSYLNKDAQRVYWADKDGFGKPNDGFSALAIFWANPPLKYAMLLACSLILLYIAFSSKRKRRLVPLATPRTNDSIAFVQTIRNLYLQKKDNRNIAIKMMTYFLEHVRNRYHLNTNLLNAEFIHALSRKSGVAADTVSTLMEWAAHINSVESISDQELFVINNLIYEFYKR